MQQQNWFNKKGHPAKPNMQIHRVKLTKFECLFSRDASSMLNYRSTLKYFQYAMDDPLGCWDIIIIKVMRRLNTTVLSTEMLYSIH